MNEPTITYESLKETLRQLEASQLDAELPIFLSDLWPAYRILKNGGYLYIAADGSVYAIAKPPSLLRLI